MGDGADAALTPQSRARSYAAFISYSHAEEEVGDWLHKRLESYRVPSPLVGRHGTNGAIGKRLGKVFRDRVELSAAHDLGAEIRRALEQSDALIVLCSPRACASRYVGEEIRYFKQLGKGDRLFAAIIDGEPHAAGKPGRSASEECFPPSLIYRIDGAGQLTSLAEANEPIAADFREGKDGRENGSLKLIAGLLGLGLDELVQRERQAERRRRLGAYALAAAMSVLALSAVGAGVFAWWQRGVAAQNEARAISGENAALEQREVAQRERDRALASQRAEEMQRLFADEQRQVAVSERDRAAIARARATLEAARQTAVAGDWVTAGLVAREVEAALPAGSLEASLAHGLRIEAGAAAREREVRALPYVRSTLTGIRAPFDLPAIANFDATGRYLAISYFTSTEARVLDARTGEAINAFEVDGSFERFVDLETNTLVTGVTRNDMVCVSFAEMRRYECPERLGDTWGNLPDNVVERGGRFIFTRRDGSVFEFESPPDALRRMSLSPAHHAAFVTTPRGHFVWRLDGEPSRILARHHGAWDAGISEARPRAAFNDARRLVAVTREDGAIEVLSYDGGLIATLAGHASFVEALAFDVEADELVSYGRDGSLRRWRVGDMPQAISFGEARENVTSSAFDPVARIWYLGSRDGSLAGIAVATNTISNAAPFNRAVTALAANNGVVVAGRGDGRVSYSASGTGGEFVELTRHRDSVTAIALDPLNARAATAGADDVVLVWDLASRRELCRLRHESSVLAVAFDGADAIVSATSSGYARRWDLRSCREALSARVGENSRATAIAPMGAALLVGTSTGEVYAVDGSRNLVLLTQASGTVLRIRVLRDGPVAIAAADGFTRLVDVNQRAEIARVRFGDPLITVVEFTPDEDGVLYWSGAVPTLGRVGLRLRDGAPLRCLTAAQRTRYGLPAAGACGAQWPPTSG